MYEHSTVLWLPRIDGEIPDQLCPVHGTPMSVEQVELRGGLPSPNLDDQTPVGKRRQAYEHALAQAEETLFPERHWSAWAGP